MARDAHCFLTRLFALILCLTVANSFNIGLGYNALRYAGSRDRSLRHTCRSISMQSKSNRPDGATEEQIRQAYETYEELMATNNFGQGYWMDSPFQFFINIKQAIDRNFGTGGRPANPLAFLDNSPKTVDLNDTPFKPLVPLGEDDDDLPLPSKPLPSEPAIAMELESPKMKTKTLKKGKSKTAGSTSVASSTNTATSNDADALKRKLAELEEAKRRAEEEAARIKAQLSE